MKWIVKVIFVLLLGVFIFAAILRGVWMLDSENQRKIFTDSRMASSFKRINDKLPIMLDEITRFDSVDVKGRIIIHYYTILPSNDPQMEVIDVYDVRLLALEKYCFNQKAKFFSKIDVSLNYIYRDAAGKEMDSFILHPEDCDIK